MLSLFYRTGYFYHTTKKYSAENVQQHPDKKNYCLKKIYPEIKYFYRSYFLMTRNIRLNVIFNLSLDNRT